MSTYESTFRDDWAPADAADFRAIADLTIAYAWAIDSREFECLRRVFLANATAHLGEYYEGLDAIIGKIDSALTPLDASQHLVANHQVRVNGGEASSRCYFQAQHVRNGVDGGANFIIAGRYEDELVRTRDGWRIKHRSLRRDWSDGNFNVVRR